MMSSVILGQNTWSPRQVVPNLTFYLIDIMRICLPNIALAPITEGQRTKTYFYFFQLISRYHAQGHARVRRFLRDRKDCDLISYILRPFEMPLIFRNLQGIKSDEQNLNEP